MLKPSRLQAVDPQRTAGLYLTTQSAQTHMRLDIRFLGGGAEVTVSRVWSILGGGQSTFVPALRLPVRPTVSGFQLAVLSEITSQWDQGSAQDKLAPNHARRAQVLQ